MTQQDINQSEWSNPQNWSGPKLFGLYHSKLDTRLWVPKRSPSMGWTINVGHSGGMALFVGILVGIFALLFGACLVVAILAGIILSMVRNAL